MSAQFQDITPPRRSIRDIPLKGDRTFRPPSSPSYEIDPPAPHSPTPPPPPPPPIYFDETPRQSRPRRRWGWALTIIILILAALFGSSYLFARANVKVTPKITATNIDQTFTADQKPANESVLPYTLITLEKEGSSEVTATGEGPVSVKASGQIIIYNNSASSQDLIATTRFETPEGLIYRIDKNITVAAKTAAGPGSIEATVYADQPGDKYNSGPKDFTIPGFKGSDKYQSFYARSKTSLAGGFVGNQKQASAADVAAAHTKIEGDLGREVLEEARGQKPDNFILFNGAVLSNFSALPNGSSTGKTVIVREKVTAKIIVFNKDTLNAFILKSVGAVPSTAAVKDLENLSFSLTNKDTFLSGTSTAITFNLKGPAKLASLVDPLKLAADLSGKGRGDLTGVLANYPGVDKAEAVFQPPWLFSFPKDPAKIKIELLDE